MKLYTEEQVRIMLGKARMHNMDDSEMFTDDYLIEQQTPIELPSDEDIEKYINSFPYTKHLDDGQYNDGVMVGAELGIEWMEEQILKQQL